MKHRRRYVDYLRDILDHAQAAIDFLHDVEDAETLASDRRTLWATIRALEVIGEAARHVPEDVRLAHPEIPWRGMIGMCDKVIHGYFGVEPMLVWTTVRDDLPAMCRAVAVLVRTIEAEGTGH